MMLMNHMLCLLHRFCVCVHVYVCVCVCVCVCARATPKICHVLFFNSSCGIVNIYSSNHDLFVTRVRNLLILKK